MRGYISVSVDQFGYRCSFVLNYDLDEYPLLMVVERVCLVEE